MQVPSLGRRRPALPRDEVAEAQARQRQRRILEVALQQVEWAHERTRQCMEDDHLAEADEYACTTAGWLDRLVELDKGQ